MVFLVFTAWLILSQVMISLVQAFFAPAGYGFLAGIMRPRRGHRWFLYGFSVPTCPMRQEKKRQGSGTACRWSCFQP